MNELFDAPSFKDQQQAWSNPPVDDIGYLSSKDMLELPDETLKAMIERMEQTRYTGWRNWNRHWRDVLGLDTTKGKLVMDYGCGVGLEALQYAKTGNEVTVADIVPNNVKLAERVLWQFGYECSRLLLKDDPRTLDVPWAYDVIHCAGVLHHIPKPHLVIEAMHRWLGDGGELRLMLYSDEAWRIATGTEPPEGDVSAFVEFETFVRHWDGVGDWADWYDKPKLMNLTKGLFRLDRYRPLTSDGAYVGAVLIKEST